MAEPSISHKKHEWGTTGDSPFKSTKAQNGKSMRQSWRSPPQPLCASISLVVGSAYAFCRVL